MSEQAALGIDIGGTNVRFALLDSKMNLKHPVLIRAASLGTGDLVDNLLDVVDEYAAEHNVNLVGTGVGIPGIVRQDGTVLSCPNIGGLEGVRLGDLITARLGVPTFVGKDTNFLLYGEYQELKQAGYGNVLGFYIGTGFGAAFIIDGQLLLGSRGFAGELGHIPLIGKDGLCGCGNRGCLEVYGAGRALTEYARRENQDVAEFFSSAQNGKAVKEFIQYVAVGVATAVNIFDPQCIVLGGGVLAMVDFPLEELQSTIRSMLRSDEQRHDLVMVQSNAGVFGGCLGAGAYCWSQLGSNKGI